MIANRIFNLFLFIVENYKYLLFFWMTINLAITFLIKSALKRYYHPQKKKILIDGQEKEVDNIHEIYKEFSRQDNEISFFNLYFAFCTYTWLRACIWIGLLVLTYIECK